MNRQFNRILIIQTAFIGDAILATALVEKLKQYYPSIIIDVLVRKGNEIIFNTNPHVNNTLVWDKSKGKYRTLFKLIIKVRKLKYDIVINLQRFLSTGLITTVSNAPIKSGFKKNPLSYFLQYKAPHKMSGEHEVVRNQQLIAFITDKQASKPKIYVTPEVENEIKKYQNKKYICIAPSSVWFTKQLPYTKWIEFIKLIKQDLNIYLLGSKSDAAICQIIENETEGKATSLCGKLSLIESAALMKTSHMNFVNDSAPLHLCSAVDAPVVAIFCSTTPKFGFGPLSKNSTIIETSQILSCRPCGLHGKRLCPQKHFNCANTITATQLLNCIPD